MWDIPQVEIAKVLIVCLDRGWLDGAAAHALRAAHTWATVFPPIAHLRASSPTQRSVTRMWAEHARDVIPGLWAETHDRLRSAATTRRQRVHG
jgi:hypothetical protein